MTLSVKDGPPPGRAEWPRRLGAFARRNLLGLAASRRPERNRSANLPAPAEPPTPAAWPRSPDLLDPD
jgi:hypothetical protein